MGRPSLENLTRCCRSVKVETEFFYSETFEPSDSNKMDSRASKILHLCNAR